MHDDLKALPPAKRELLKTALSRIALALFAIYCLLLSAAFIKSSIFDEPERCDCSRTWNDLTPEERQKAIDHANKVLERAGLR